MSIIDIIRKKRDGGELSGAEIDRVVAGTSDGSVPEYQLSALLMAIYFAGMTPGETARLTASMAASGARLDLSGIAAPKVDKHSTGGVGDKVSLILAPVVASCGAAVPMISGRGLGHTGGTVDKLESIPGFRTDLSLAEVRRQVADIGVAMAAQTAELAPADRRLYAIRDVTATVESLPLITASILSKKFAENLDALVMDVKFGRGAFMRELSDATALAESIGAVCEAEGLACTTLLTRMDFPLGRRIGNRLEVCESVRMLRAEEEPPLLAEVTFALCGACIHAAGIAATLEEGTELARRAIADGSAYRTFLRMVERQGGDVASVERAEEPMPTVTVTAGRAGFVTGIDALELGHMAIELGAGRRTLDDVIHPEAGIIIHRHVGEYAEQGEALCSLVERRAGVGVLADRVLAAFTIADEAPLVGPMVHAVL